MRGSGELWEFARPAIRSKMFFTQPSELSAPQPIEVKVVLLGETGVGKSSLVLRFVSNTFKPYSASTIGASYMSKQMNVDGSPIKFQIWDTASQVRQFWGRLLVESL